MDISNLATIFAPTVMHSRESRDDPSKFLAEIGFSTTVLLHLIKKSSLAFETHTRRRSISEASTLPYIPMLAGSHATERYVLVLIVNFFIFTVMNLITIA